MNLNTENIGPLAAELKCHSQETSFYVKIGKEIRCGPATLKKTEYGLVLEFAETPKGTKKVKK